MSELLETLLGLATPVLLAAPKKKAAKKKVAPKKKVAKKKAAPKKKAVKKAAPKPVATLPPPPRRRPHCPLPRPSHRPRRLGHKGHGRLMRLIVNWILCAAFPFVLAASKSKRKPVKKMVKRPAPATRSRAKRPQVKRARVKKTARPPRRSPRQVARGRQVAARARPPLQPSVTPAVALKLVEPEPPPKPVPPIGRAILLSPENEKFVDNFHPTFRWLSVGGATRYEIAWGEDIALAASHTILSIATEATVPVEETLHLGTTYYWRVRGGNESGWGPWSAIASFHVLEEIT